MEANMKSKNILIPLDLMMKTAELLTNWDISSYDYAIQCEYNDVVDAIQKKMRAVDLRWTYSKMVYAKGEDERFDARIEYLKQKHEYR
jgi:hypothetical protein